MTLPPPNGPPTCEQCGGAMLLTGACFTCPACGAYKSIRPWIGVRCDCGRETPILLEDGGRGADAAMRQVEEVRRILAEGIACKGCGCMLDLDMNGELCVTDPPPLQDAA